MSIPQNYLINLIETIVQEQLEKKIWQAIGVVTQYNTDDHTAKVMLSHEQIETDFIRISSHYSGNGFGDRSPLEPGTEVVVTFFTGSLESGVVTASLWSSEADVALPETETGEKVFTHKSGSAIRMKNDGSMVMKTPNHSTVQASADGDVTVKNDKLSVSIGNDGLLLIGNSSGTLKMTADGKFALANDTAELLAALGDLLEQMVTPSNILGAGSPASVVSQFNPEVLLQLQQVKLKIQALKAS